MPGLPILLSGLGAFLGRTLGWINPKLLLALVAAVAIYWVGYSRADTSAELAVLKSSNRALEARLTIARTAATLANEQVLELEAQQASHQEKIDALQADLATRPGRAECALSGDDLDWLLDIR